MRVVVITGSRDWTASRPIDTVIAGADLVISGGAPGADSIADRCARNRDILCIPVQARWDEAGSWAGRERNRRIAQLARIFRTNGHQVECHAFPTEASIGTWDCKRELEKCDFKVEVHR